MMKNLKRLISLALCLILAMATIPAMASDLTEVLVTSVIMTSSIYLRVGGSESLNARVSPANATNTGVSFSSGNDSIATVDYNGIVRGVSAGTTYIYATAADKGHAQASCQVTVLGETKVTLDKTSVSLKVGDTAYLTPTITPYEIYQKGYTFTSGNINVCSVSSSGMITGTGAGTTTVRVTASDGTSASCTVTVGAPVNEIQLSYTSVSVSTGRNINIGATVLPTNATNKGLTWKSSDENVATVDAFGNVTTWCAGFATVTATAADGSGVSASCQVSVSGTNVTKVPTATPSPTPAPTGTPTPTLVPGTTPTPPANGVTAYVNTASGSLNMRRSPNGTIIDRIPYAGSFTLLEKGDKWCYMWYRGQYGYVMTQYVRFDKLPTTPTLQPGTTATPAPVTTLAPDSPTGTVAFVNTEKGSLNMRKSPNGTVLRTIPEKASFTLITPGTTWCYAWYKGTYGYVMTKFVATAGSTSLPTGTSKPATAVTPSPVPLSGSVARVQTSNGGKLNLRKQPDTASARVRLIENGAIIDILTYGKTWCYARYQGSTGYVMTSYLYLGSGVNTTSNVIATTPTPTGSTAATPTVPVSGASKYAQVTTAKGGLNLRKGAGTGYARIYIIPQNAYVTVLENGKTWCKVNYNGHVGYVMTTYLKMI